MTVTLTHNPLGRKLALAGAGLALAAILAGCGGGGGGSNGNSGGTTGTSNTGANTGVNTGTLPSTGTGGDTPPNAPGLD